MKLQDLTGKVFSRLTVLNRDEGAKSKHTMWLCRCDCGNEKVIVGVDLTSGHTKSCGCLQKETASRLNREDLSGQVFGRLTVLKMSSRDKQGAVMWNCRCSCGNEKVIRGSKLKNGNTQSCGCFQQESRGQSSRKNLMGQTWSRLTVLKEAGRSKNGRIAWLCRCECGNEIVVVGTDLMAGNTKSCGCLQKEVTSLRSRKDLAGKIFNRLTVLKEDGRTRSGRITWLCRCSCGKDVVVAGTNLISGQTKSCGCLSIEKLVQRSWNPDREQIKARKKIHSIVHSMLRRILKNKSEKSEIVLGYTKQELKEHLESQFVEGMSWGNHGNKEGQWSVDHVKPIVAFVQEGVTDPKIINALENLAPLWHIDNLKKAQKLNWANKEYK